VLLIITVLKNHSLVNYTISVFRISKSRLDTVKQIICPQRKLLILFSNKIGHMIDDQELMFEQ